MQLVGDLSKVIVATLATAALLVVNANAWSIADQLSTLRPPAIGVLSATALGATVSMRCLVRTTTRHAIAPVHSSWRARSSRTPHDAVRKR